MLKFRQGILTVKYYRVGKRVKNKAQKRLQKTDEVLSWETEFDLSGRLQVGDR